MGKYFSRMGDGSPEWMSEAEIMADLVEGSEDAADRGQIPALSKEEYGYLQEILCSRHKFVSVEPGKEIILTYDAATLKIRRVGVHVDRIQALQIYEKIMGADTMELAHVDYSYKPVKPIAGFEQPILEQALLSTHIPLFYGAQPNLGLYSQPDGPFPNPAELLPMGKIKEAQESYELAVEDLVKDIVYTGSLMYESGADGINLDTSGAAGDADFLAALLATEKLKAKYPDSCIEMGMAGEFVLGMHSQLTYKGKRLAGLYPQRPATGRHRFPFIRGHGGNLPPGRVVGWRGRSLCNVHYTRTCLGNGRNAGSRRSGCSHANVPRHENR